MVRTTGERVSSSLKLVIFDRDGTLNHDRDDFVTSAAEWQPIPGAMEAVARLNHSGWHAVIATNQSGLGRGLFDLAALNAMHLKLVQTLAAEGGRIDAVFYCPHIPADGCTCRKPLPGLPLQIAERYGIDLKSVPMVGDSLRDIEAAQAAGCEPHLVLTGKAAGLGAEQIAEWSERVPALHVHKDLGAFAEFVIQRERTARGLPEQRDSMPGALA